MCPRQQHRDWLKYSRPGGGLIVANPAENRLAFDDGLGKLNDFDEPYYSTHTAEALGKMFSDCGM